MAKPEDNQPQGLEGKAAEAKRKGEAWRIRTSDSLLKRHMTGNPLFSHFIHVTYWPRTRGQYSEAWAKEAERYLGELIAHFGMMALEDIEPADVSAWWALELAKGKPRRSTVALAHLRRIFNRAIEWGYRTDNPTRYIRRPRPPRRPRRPPSPRERAALGEAANSRLAPYLTLAALTGGRRGSLFSLRERDIDLDRAVVRFCNTKTGDDVEVPLTPEAVSLLHPLLTGNPDAPVLQQYSRPESISQALRRLRQRLGLPDAITFHGYRHAFATDLLKKGVDLETVRDLLGHHSISTTGIYLHTTDERKRAAVRKLGVVKQGINV